MRWPTTATHANIFKALGRNPNILRAYLRLGTGLWRHCGLDLKTRELAILRSAFNTGSRYEWHQHVRIGRDAGLSDDEIRAVGDPQESSLFDERVKTLLGYVDALNAPSPPSDATFARMRDTWGEETTVGVTVLVPFYEMTAKFLAAMQVEPEEKFVGWAL
ncbi:MAG: carboxymuconolactone decarboxylase family protein [Dehalococcoidia bacterium]|nr:carboxymuconolactone decarboxylase family protein [Dehalococcoidia bacterium]